MSPGEWTAELAPHANTVTAVDSSPEALAICRQRVEMPHVSLVQADLFAWQPQQRYDLLFFAAWLSHVPPSGSMPSGRSSRTAWPLAGGYFVIDELPAASTVERAAAGQAASVVRRRLTTGESYRAVKVTYGPDALRARLAALGWDAEVREVGWRYFWATASQAGPKAPDSGDRPVAVR